MNAGRDLRRCCQGRMNGAAHWRSIAASVTAILALSATGSVAGEAANPAHAIADRFSRASEPSSNTATTQAPKATASERRAADQQKAYEEDMLNRARAEAEARAKADMERASRDALAHAEAERAKVREAQARASQRAAQEREHQAAAAKAEAERREAEHKRREAERLAAQRDHESQELAERLRAARQAREIERARLNDEAEQMKARARALAEAEASQKALARRRAELSQRTKRLADRIEERKRNRVAEQREMPAPAGLGVGNSIITTGATTGADRQHSGPGNDHHVTILLVMEPGKRGIRRWNKSADPMLCIEGRCYISSGASHPALEMSRRKGFGPSVALGMRAGDCRGKLTCVFRGVDLKATRAWMQPVDLRILRHDRREAQIITADPTCSVSRGRLHCGRPISGNGYSAWVIPETVAREAGEALLQDAVTRELDRNVRTLSQRH